MLFLNSYEKIKSYEDSKNIITTFLRNSLTLEEEKETLLININNSESFKINFNTRIFDEIRREKCNIRTLQHAN